MVFTMSFLSRMSNVKKNIIVIVEEELEKYSQILSCVAVSYLALSLSGRIRAAGLAPGHVGCTMQICAGKSDIVTQDLLIKVVMMLTKGLLKHIYAT